MAEPERFAELLEFLADGAPVDWVAVELAATSDDDRARLRQLRRLELAVAHQRRSPARGKTWSHLVLIEKIGAGAFGEVYRAHDPRLARDVALKLLYEPMLADDVRASAVIEEGRLLARVRHPGVVTVYGAECRDGQVGIWTEFIEGQTLQAIVSERGPMSSAEVASIGLDLCRALAAVHEAGLLHRDIKAQNVMREAGGRIVLMDFGTGRDLEPVPGQNADVSGTPLYLAPELFTGGEASVASDIYALGVLMYQLVTGSFPIAARTVREVETAHRVKARVHLRGARPDLPVSFVEIVDRALAPAPEARFASAAAMEAALADVIGTERGAAADRVLADPVSKRLGRRPWFWSGAVAVLLAMIAGLSYFYSLSNSRLQTLPFQSRDWVLITAFDNRTGDHALDDMVEYAIAHELANSQFVNVVQPERVADALRLMRQPTDSRIDVALGLEICARDGNIRALVTGQVEKLGDTYVLRANLIEPVTGATLASLNEEYQSGASLPAATSRLSARLRQTLGEDLRTNQSDLELAKVTTWSPRAVRLYTQAAHMLSQMTWHPERAVELLTAALIQDPQFASAYMLLSEALQELRRPASECLQAARRGYDLAANASERERYSIEAQYFRLSGQDDKAVASYEALTQRYRDDSRGVSKLVQMYNLIGKPEDGIPLRLQYAELRPNDLEANVDAAYIHMALRRSPLDAKKFFDRAAQLPPADGSSSSNAAMWIQLTPMRTAWLEGRVSDAVAELTRVEQNTLLKNYRTFHVQMGWAYATLGQLAKASAHVRAVGDVDLLNQHLAAFAFLNGDRAGLLERLAFFRQVPGGSYLVTSLQVHARLLSDAETRVEQLEGLREALATYVTADFALARGDTARGIALTEAAMGRALQHPVSFLAAESLAVAYERQGNLPAAIRALEQVSAEPEKLGVPGSAPFFPFWLRTRAQLAELYRKTGRIDDQQKAASQLRALLTHADSDHPILVQLRGSSTAVQR